MSEDDKYLRKALPASGKVENLYRESEVAALRARLAEVEGALKRYGKHDMTCPQSRFAGVMQQQPCSCGYNDALAALGRDACSTSA